MTEREQEIFNFIRDYINNEGISPSIRDICKGIHVTSPSGVMRHINNLSNKGFIKHHPKIARGIALYSQLHTQKEV